MIQFRWHGTKIRLDFSFFAAAALLGLLGGTGGFLRMLAACTLHEAGHLAAMLLLRQRVRSITCYGVGICIRPASYGTYGQDVLVLLAGPLCNLFMGAGIWLTAGMTPFAMLHLGLGLFNLLPYAARRQCHATNGGAGAQRAVSAADGGAALAGDLSRCDESHILWDAALSAGDTVFCEQWKTAPYRIITFKVIPHKAVRRALCGIAL